MPLPPTVSCFSKIQIGFTFLVPAEPGNPRQRAVKWVLLLLLCYEGHPACKNPAPVIPKVVFWGRTPTFHKEGWMTKAKCLYWCTPRSDVHAEVLQRFLVACTTVVVPTVSSTATSTTVMPNS